MASPPRKTSRETTRNPQKSPRLKSKSRIKMAQDEKRLLNNREISEITLKRLHTLGNQKFGSSPYSQHFKRWLANVESVLAEFESHPDIGTDDLFVKECADTVAEIKQQLENRRKRETTIDQEIKYLSDCKSHLQQINYEYVEALRAWRNQKSGQTKRLNSEIIHLKKEQDKVIRLKTGFFRGISKKERERKELEIIQKLNDKQNELELQILNFNSEQIKLQEEYYANREPLIEQIKYFRKIVREVEIDASLEDRWFACEALVDAINSLLQRKTAQHNAPI